MKDPKCYRTKCPNYNPSAKNKCSMFFNIEICVQSRKEKELPGGFLPSISRRIQTTRSRFIKRRD